MTKYFVGQRVRIVRIYQAMNAHLLGAQGRIAEIAELKNGVPGEEIAYGLDILPIEWEEDPEDGFLIWAIGFGPEQLEPILPSGRRAGTESFQELMDRLNTEKVEGVEEVGA
ncbi:hypothetical protein [Pseudoxanthomonas sp.]|uniref:hypothetical protein n=1 Tax=Pseudoxanthomonas sp. TaxID=1871049 RepID=UPI003F7EE6A2